MGGSYRIRRKSGGEGGGGYRFLEKMENLGRRGGGGWVLSELPSMVGVWIFSGTTQYPFKGLFVG